MKRIFPASCLLLLAVLVSCTDPLTVGGELLDEDRAGVGQTMDITFTTRVIEDSLRTFNMDQDAILPLFSFGSLNDEVFGSWTNSAYFTTFLSRTQNTGVAVRPEFALTAAPDVDSVVLLVPIDTSVGFYGPGRTFDIQAGLTADRIRDDMDYFSDLDCGDPVNTINANPRISVTEMATALFDTAYASGDTISLPHLRVLLNDEFTAEVNRRDGSTWNSDSTLATLVPGLYVTPTSNANGLVSLRPRTSGQPANYGLYYFFKDSTDRANERFFTNRLALWLPRYERDYTNSLVGGLLADGDDNERIAVTGQAGVITEITFGDLSALAGKVINKAELKFFRETIENYSYDTYGTPQRLALYFRNERTGDLVPINDFGFITNPTRGAVLNGSAGGQETTDSDGNIFYAPRLSLYLQNMVEGLAPNKIYLRVFPADSDPSRVILRGPQASERPATLTVTFTERGN